MILQLFKKTFFIQISWIIVFAIAFAVPHFFQNNTEYIPQTTLFLNLICFYSWLKINWLYQVISHLLLLGLAFYVKEIFAKHQLAHHSNFLSSLILIALFNFFYPFQYQFLGIVNLFLLAIAFDFILKSGDDDQVDNSIFTASFILSLASFISYSNLLIFPIIWFSFFIFQNYNWRYLPMSIVGLIIPYLFLFTWLFWFDKLELISSEWDSAYHTFYQIPQFNSIFYSIIFSILGFFLFVSLAKIIPETTAKVIDIRRKTSLSIWMMFFSLYPLIFFPDSISKNLFLIPLAGILGYYLRIVKTRRILIDIIFTTFIILLLINKYYLAYASKVLFE